MFKNTDHVNFTLIKILLQQYPREITNTVKWGHRPTVPAQ